MNLFELVAVLTLNKSDYKKGLGEAEKEASSFSSKLKNVMGTVAKVGGASLAVIGTASAAVTKTLLGTSNEVAQLGDHIDKQSQKLGMSAKAYQEWDFILTHNGASVDSLQASMKTLSTQAEKNADEFAALGISEEELANLSPEELFERVIKGLQGMEESTERTAIASALLGRGATELGPVLNSTSDDIEGLRQQAHELGKVMSDEAVKSSASYEDSLYNLQTSIGGLKNQVATNLLPSLVNVMDGLTGLFAGDDSTVGKVSEGIESLISQIGNSIPKIADMAARIIPSIVEAVANNIGPLVQGATQLIIKLVGQAPKVIKPIIKALPGIIKDVAKTIAENAPELINGVIDMILMLVQELPTILLAVAEALPDILNGIFHGLIDNLPELIAGVVELVEGLVKNLPQILASIVNAVGGLVGDLIAAIFPFGEKFKETFEGFDLGGFIGGVFEEALYIAKGIFEFFGKLMDDPAQALMDAFDGLKDYAIKVFQSLKDIVVGIFELIEAKQAAQEAAERREKINDEVAKKIEEGWIFERDEEGVWQNKGAREGTEAAAILERAAAAAPAQEVDVKVDGSVTHYGVNDKDELIGSVETVEESLTQKLQQDWRRQGG